LLTTLGNVNFDIAQSNDKKRFSDSRDFYEKALAINPKLVEIRTDFGSTYLFDEPSAPEKAVAEYEKSLKIEPKNEKTLQNMVTALIELKKIPEAEKRLGELREVNANNPSVADLQTQIAQAKVKS
jgi:tetratricopeptide (TPR) repeat protein